MVVNSEFGNVFSLAMVVKSEIENRKSAIHLTLACASGLFCPAPPDIADLLFPRQRRQAVLLLPQASKLQIPPEPLPRQLQAPDVALFR